LVNEHQRNASLAEYVGQFRGEPTPVANLQREAVAARHQFQERNQAREECVEVGKRFLIEIAELK
jgi:hypothetical protein